MKSMARVGNRRLLQIYGRDTGKFLQGLTTNDVLPMVESGGSVYTGFLNAKGRILADAFLVKTNATSVQEINGAVLLDCHESRTDDLVQHMKRFKLRSKVNIEPMQSETQVWVADSPDEKTGSTIACSDPRGSGFGWRFYTSELIDSVESLESYDTKRILSGVLEGEELTDRIPAECNLDLLNGICFSKGCYLGQELTARTQFKGLVRKRTVPVLIFPADQPIDRDSLPKSSNSVEIGMNVLEGGKRVGQFLSVSSSFGLGLVQLRLSSLDSTLYTEDGSQIIPILPFWWPSNLNLETGKMSF